MNQSSEHESRSMLSDDDRAAIRALVDDQVRFDAPMSRRTTLRIGGPADALCMPASIDGLRGLVRWCAVRDVPMLAVGSGSNLLVRDGGIRGVVLATRNLRELERLDDVRVRVQAGVSTGKLLSSTTTWQLGGVEFLGGVPGSVGGGMRMNAGTYLGEFKDVTTHVTTVRMADGALVVRQNPECGFAYRESAIPRDEIVVESELTLRPRPREEIETDVRALRQRRFEREPKKVSNSGSTFKNPPGDYAGRLIEACGLKGTRIGGAECSPAHANWLVNTGGATASDLLTLIDLVRERVRETHGVTLELEVKVVGDD